MKKRVAILAVVGSLVLANCLGLVLAYLNAGGPPSAVFPEGTNHDLGIVREGEHRVITFVLANMGGEDLRVEGIKEGCACADAKIAKTVLAPGEKTEITVSYTGRAISWQEVQTVWVLTNDPNRPISELSFSCGIQPKVFWYPTSVSFWGKPIEEKQSRWVQISTNNLHAFEIESVETSSGRLAASCAANDGGFKCTIRVTRDCPKGNYTENVTIETTVDGLERRIEIPVYLMVK